MSDVFLCVVRGVINVNKFEVRLLPSSHLNVLNVLLAVYHTVLVKCLYLGEYYRLMNYYVNLFIGLLRELKTVQTQLYMPAYHHLFSDTLPFENGGAHYCIYNGTVLTC